MACIITLSAISMKRKLCLPHFIGAPARLAMTGIFLSALHAVAVPVLPVINTNHIVVVTNSIYGAVGDGITTNTTAIQSAINAAAAGGTTNGAAGGTVEIPPGVYMCGPLTMASAVNLQIDAGAILRMLPLGMYPGGTTTGTTFISANNLHDIEISGAGAIDGQGAPWWPYANTNGALRPIMIQPNSCDRLLIQGLTLSNSPMFHIAIGGNADNSTVQGVTVLAPSSSANPPSHNTDACDVSGANILVENCNISTGDDDFTCGGGTSNVILTNNTYGNGHGISIGSYTDNGGVSNILVINCTMNGTANGIRIKSDNDRGGLVQDISYMNISMTNVDFPIQVYSYYNEVGTPINITPLTAASETVAAVASTTPVYRNITFSNITATAVSGYPIGIIWARTEMPATNIVFDKINLTGYQNFCLYNVSGVQFIDSTFNLPAGITNFAMFNARVIITNSGFASSLLNFDGLTTNGYGNGFSFYNAPAALQNTNAFGAGPLALSGSTLAVGNSLTLFPSTTINYTLGTNAAKLAVTGNLTLGGTNNISAGDGFTNGVYTVMTYTGALNGAPPVVGSAPAGYSYAFDTSTAGQVNLDVSGTVSAVPASPLNVIATAGNQLVSLSWSPSATATSYNIGRSTTNGGTYSTVLTGILTTNYSDIQVTNGTTYYYVVAGLNSAGVGPNSAPVSATPQSPVFGLVNENVFNDFFSASTVNSGSVAPTVSAANYEIVSSKSWNPTPSIAAGHFKFGIGTTTSGCVEAQALFTNTPVTLAIPGDNLLLTVTFTNTSGLLTQSEAMGFGLYHSGGNYPVPGGLNATLATSDSGNATGNAQTWMGYAGQIAFSGGSSQIMTRSPQTGTDNNNQDLVTTGSSSSYSNPAAATVGVQSPAGAVTLVTGNPYTEVLAITLTATNTLGITNYLYSGTNTNGIPIAQFGGVASGSTFLTNTFDALAVGWRATANTYATAIDINQITVNATLNLAPPANFLNPTNITAQMVGGQWQLSWPADHLGWRLQVQTNDLNSGLGTNWATVANSTNVDQVTIAVNPNNGAVFYRLIYP
jgi:polygalacturonase